MNIQKTLITFSCVALLSLHCGGGDSGSSKVSTDLPETNTNINADLQDLYKNTFQVPISVNPQTLNFGTTGKNTKKRLPFSLNNETGQDLSFNINLIDSSGNYRLVFPENNLSTVALPVSAGSSTQINLDALAEKAGIHTAIVQITSPGHQGEIHLPARITVGGPSELRVISASYLCDNSIDESDVYEIDFKRVAFGIDKRKTIKICNNGGETIKINQIRFRESASNQVSSVIGQNPPSNFSWDLNALVNEELLNPFNYFNPPKENLRYPEKINYDGSQVMASNSYRSSVELDGDFIPSSNIILPPDSYIKVHINFSPTLNIDAGANKVFNPIPLSATMDIDSSEGVMSVDVLGATGGQEAMLKVVASPQGEAVPSCDQVSGIDLDSENAALHFGTVDIYEDFFSTAKNNMNLTFCNRGSKPLQVSLSEMNQGFFTYDASENNDLRFPFTVEPQSSKKVTISYHPTPREISQCEANDPECRNSEIFTNDTYPRAEEGYNFGQLMIEHTGANGPRHPITLIGEQSSGRAIQIPIDGVNLKNEHLENRPRNLACAKIGRVLNKELIVENKSEKYSLTTRYRISIKRENAADVEGPRNQDKLIFRAGFLPNGSVNVPPQSRRSIPLSFFITNQASDGDTLIGRIRLDHNFQDNGRNVQQDFGNRVIPHDAYFKITASETGVCSSGSGQPVDGDAIFVLDRITMSLFGLPEPNRNHPAFKFHLPLELNQDEGYAKLKGLPFNVGTPRSPVEQIRIHAHQIGSATSCFPLPTNPYKQEFEPGSWDGPYSQCSKDFDTGQNRRYIPQREGEADLWSMPDEDGDRGVDGSAACISENGAQTYTIQENGEDVELKVYYHEFVKLKDNSCTPHFEGKFSTFFLRPGETITQKFDRLAELPSSSSEKDYQAITRPFQFGSYIQFYEDYNRGDCNYSAGTTLTGEQDSDAIEDCWKAIVSDKSVMKRSQGMIEECGYFQFEVLPGCIPGEEGCDSDPNDPDSWEGYGEYEPHPDDATKWNLTLRNAHIRAFTLTHAYNEFFGHAGRLLYSDLFVTFTTKAVGVENDNNNPYDDELMDLVHVDVRSDFSEELIRMARNSRTDTHFLKTGVGSRFTTGELLGDLDDETLIEENALDEGIPISDDFDCDVDDPLKREHCRGNFAFRDGNVVMAGEPCNFENGAQCLLVGLSSFHGKKGVSPDFTAEFPDGRGQALYFSFHGCLRTPEEDADGNFKLPADTGCFAPEIDDEEFTRPYLQAGILEQEDLSPDNPDSKALINFRIFEEDRQRYTNYYDHPAHFNYLSDFSGKRSPISGDCGFGM